jgi:hypothetical protein
VGGEEGKGMERKGEEKGWEKKKFQIDTGCGGIYLHSGGRGREILSS